MNTSSNLFMHDSFSRIVSPDSTIVVVEHEDAFEERRKAERLRQQAFEAAEKECAVRVVEEQEKNRKLWVAMDASFNVFMKQVESQIARQLVEMSVRLAEIIVRRELPDSAMVKDIITEVLAPVSDLQGAKVRVNPGDLEVLMSARPEGGRQDLTSRLEFVADSSLLPGDVLIESKNGYFDARISERLKLLQEKLMERTRYSNEHNAKS